MRSRACARGCLGCRCGRRRLRPRPRRSARSCKRRWTAWSAICRSNRSVFLAAMMTHRERTRPALTGRGHPSLSVGPVLLGDGAHGQVALQEMRQRLTAAAEERADLVAQAKHAAQERDEVVRARMPAATTQRRSMVANDHASRRSRAPLVCAARALGQPGSRRVGSVSGRGGGAAAGGERGAGPGPARL